MEVYKFGGASVKNANGVKNVISVLKKTKSLDVLLVVSAMGKMTNAFEKIVDSYINNKGNLSKYIDEVMSFHQLILNNLFQNKSLPIFKEIELVFIGLSSYFINNKNKDYNYVYDQVVSLAEILSTKIISAYLNHNGVKNTWVDAKKHIKTDGNYREANVNWTTTNKNIQKLNNTSKLIITQGFIASDQFGNTTTLGREGSDYTAAIFAYCLNAKSVTVFKDVAGVLNADPQLYDEVKLLSKISYREAIEMAFYGASVIHPKTLQPLQSKEIPLFVKSFIDPLKKGTVIGRSIDLEPVLPCYIVKKNQILISIATRDFSFMMEKNISEVFELLHKHKLKVNLIQNTAISFSVCLEDKFNQLAHFLLILNAKYKVKYNNKTTLLTIRHFDKKSIEKVKATKVILLQQISRETVQFILK